MEPWTDAMVYCEACPFSDEEGTLLAREGVADCDHCGGVFCEEHLLHHGERCDEANAAATTAAEAYYRALLREGIV